MARSKPTPTTPADPVYTVSGGTPVDETVWPPADVTTVDGQPLYYFSGDQPGQPPQGETAGGGAWHLYTGEQVDAVIEPAPATSTVVHVDACPLCFPLGLDLDPAGVTAVGCEHGTWTLTADGTVEATPE